MLQRQVGVELDALLRLGAVEARDPLVAVLLRDLAAGAPDPRVHAELGVAGNRERHHLGVRGLDGLARRDDLVPAGRGREAELLEDVGAVDERATPAYQGMP